MGERKAEVSRSTRETNINIGLNLDGSGKADVNTGIGFFDHMLEGFARHGLFDLKCLVKGDLNVDSHHTIEDTGIVLGKAIKEALSDKAGIVRFGECILPMDESCVMTAIDLSGRPYLVFDETLTVPKVGDFDTEMVHEFFYAITYSAEMNLVIKQICGVNNHHIIEATFKSFAKSLDRAVQKDPRISGVLSTKGTL